jgi:hypothetical protein
MAIHALHRAWCRTRTTRCEIFTPFLALRSSVTTLNDTLTSGFKRKSSLELLFEPLQNQKV